MVIDIPIQIDSVKTMEDFQRTRCTYFRLDFEGERLLQTYLADPGWMAIWGDSGVLMGPTEAKDNRFSSPNSIERTLDNLEEAEGISWDIGHIWLPNQILMARRKGRRPEIGDIYRLSARLFVNCHQFTAEMITENEWLEFCLSAREELQFSATETAVFQDWREWQITRARERYHHKDYDQYRLPKKQSFRSM